MFLKHCMLTQAPVSENTTESNTIIRSKDWYIPKTRMMWTWSSEVLLSYVSILTEAFLTLMVDLNVLE